MNGRALIILFLVAAAFFFGWTGFRFTARQSQTKLSSERQLATPAQPREEPPSVAAASNPPANAKDTRMSLIADLLERRDKRIAEIKERAKGFETEADRLEIAKITKETDEQIKSMLSDGEASALQVEEFKRTDLGKALLEHFAPNPNELAAISNHEKALADVVAAGGDLEDVQSRSIEKLKTTMGEERTADFMNYRDPEFVDKLNLVKRFNLPRKTAFDLANIQVEHGKIMLERIQQGNFRPLDPNVKETFRSRVKELLGAEAGEVYIREAKSGGWLR